MKGPALVGMALLALTACANTTGYADHRFESIAELRDVLAKASFTCVSTDDKVKTVSALDKYGFDSLPCTDGHAEIWRSDVTRAEIQGKSWNALKPGQVRIEGVNWSVTVPTDRLDQVNKVLKGTVK